MTAIARCRKSATTWSRRCGSRPAFSATARTSRQPPKSSPSSKTSTRTATSAIRRTSTIRPMSSTSSSAISCRSRRLSSRAPLPARRAAERTRAATSRSATTRTSSSTRSYSRRTASTALNTRMSSSDPFLHMLLPLEHLRRLRRARQRQCRALVREARR